MIGCSTYFDSVKEGCVAWLLNQVKQKKIRFSKEGFLMVPSVLNRASIFATKIINAKL